MPRQQVQSHPPTAQPWGKTVPDMPHAVQREPPSQPSSHHASFVIAPLWLGQAEGSVGRFAVTAAPGGGAGGVGSLLPLAPDSPVA
eukprot:5998705-Pyramimonas_sp.AAC.1